MAISPPPFPTGSSLAELCQEIKSIDAKTRELGPWKSGAFSKIASRGCFAGWIKKDDGGTEASETEIMTFLISIASSCLTTALALTQWASAVSIISRSSKETRSHFLPDLITGKQFTTVGISQLTTSRQHLGRPILTAKKTDAGWSLHGKCPWVTGADSVNTLVTGAVPLNSKESQGTPHFFILRMNTAGIQVAPPMDLLALTGSRTSSIELENVPAEVDITPQSQTGPRTGGLGTTALAIGSTRASLAILEQESRRRDLLKPITNEIEKEVSTIEADIFEATTCGIDTQERNLLRQRANTLVTRTSQAALTASKGAGFVKGHPVERLIRESMFFLVWSCPQSVTESLLCDFAGIDSSLMGPQKAHPEPSIVQPVVDASKK